MFAIDPDPFQEGHRLIGAAVCIFTYAYLREPNGLVVRTERDIAKAFFALQHFFDVAAMLIERLRRKPRPDDETILIGAAGCHTQRERGIGELRLVPDLRCCCNRRYQSRPRTHRSQSENARIKLQHREAPEGFPFLCRCRMTSPQRRRYNMRHLPIGPTPLSATPARRRSPRTRTPPSGRSGRTGAWHRP